MREYAKFDTEQRKREMEYFKAGMEKTLIEEILHWLLVSVLITAFGVCGVFALNWFEHFWRAAH